MLYANLDPHKPGVKKRGSYLAESLRTREDAGYTRRKMLYWFTHPQERIHRPIHLQFKGEHIHRNYPGTTRLLSAIIQLKSPRICLHTTNVALAEKFALSNTITVQNLDLGYDQQDWHRQLMSIDTLYAKIDWNVNLTHEAYWRHIQDQTVWLGHTL